MIRLIALVLTSMAFPNAGWASSIFVGYDQTNGIEKIDSVTGVSLGFLNLGTTSLGANLNSRKYDSVEFGPDGNLYIASSGWIGMYAIDPNSGSIVQEYSTYSPVDIAFDDAGLGYVASFNGPSSQIITFDPSTGANVSSFSTYYPAALAVQPNDVSPVPIPATAWLFASSLGVFGYLGKRKAST